MRDGIRDKDWGSYLPTVDNHRGRLDRDDWLREAAQSSPPILKIPGIGRDIPIYFGACPVSQNYATTKHQFEKIKL